MDFFDPNTWVKPEHEFRIYGDNHANSWVVVDEEDYHWAIRYRWNWLRMHTGKSLRAEKWYLRRAVSRWENGVRSVKTALLHIEILRRFAQPPSDAHIWAGHLDDDTSNCLRSNLGWVTPSENQNQRIANGNGKIRRAAPRGRFCFG